MNLRRLCLPAIVGIFALAAGSAQASITSGVVKYGGYYKMSSDKITFNVNGFVKVDCFDVEIVSNAVSVVATKITASGGSTGASHVKFDACSKGATDATVETFGTWTIAGKQRTNVDPESWSLAITVDKAVVTVPDETCVVTLDNPQTVEGVFGDSNPPANPNTALAFLDAVSWTGIGCFINKGTADIEGIFTVTANTQQDFKGTDLEVEVF